MQIFIEILPVGAEMIHGATVGQTEREGQKGVTNLRAAFNNSTIAPEECEIQ